MNTATPPLNFAQLNTPVEEAARDLGVPVARVRRMLCTLIVSQMLPDAVAIKGGMGVKLRMGGEWDTSYSGPRRVDAAAG